MENRTFRYIWIISILIGASLACSTLNQVNYARQTAQAVVTEVKGIATQGAPLLQTAQAFATVEGSQFLGTAQAFATQNPGLVDTAQAFVTEQGPGLIATAQAFITQEGPGALATAQAFATQHPDLAATGWALATQAASGSEATQKPPDIPILPSDQISNLYTTRETVTYFTSQSFTQVVDFYKTEMKNNGWSRVAEGSVQTANVAVLNFTKLNRTASVVINNNPGSSQVTVIISIQTH